MAFDIGGIVVLRLFKLLQFFIVTSFFCWMGNATNGDFQIDTDATLEGEKNSTPRERLAHVVQRHNLVKRDLIKIQSAFAMPAVGKRTTAAAYVIIKNDNDIPITITGVMAYPGKEDIFSPIAGQIEFRSVMKDADGTRRNVQLGRIVIPAGQTFEMKPGESHILFSKLRQELKEGNNIWIHLTVRDLEGPLDIEVPISSKKPK